jgi:hypothetical protein
MFPAACCCFLPLIMLQPVAPGADISYFAGVAVFNAVSCCSWCFLPLLLHNLPAVHNAAAACFC